MKRFAQRRRSNSLFVDALEKRMLCDITLAGGVLSLVGDPVAANSAAVILRRTGKFTATLHVQSKELTLSDVTFIRIIGGVGADTVSVDTGIRAPAFIQTRDGNDTVQGGGGNDTVHAGGGDDVISGRTGDDFLFGDRG